MAKRMAKRVGTAMAIGAMGLGGLVLVAPPASASVTPAPTASTTTRPTTPPVKPGLCGPSRPYCASFTGS